MEGKLPKVQVPYVPFQNGLFLPTRTISLGFESSLQEEQGGCLNSVSVMRFIENLMSLEYQNHQAINILLTNVGGDVYLGLAVYDAIKNSKCHIRMTVYGACMSMGVAILQAADHRIIMPRATVMVHRGTLSVPDGTTQDVELEAAEGKRVDRIYYEILSERTGMSLKDAEEICNTTHYMDAKEVLGYHLADEIYGKKPAAKKKKKRN